jgi:hypothetical protein
MVMRFLIMPRMFMAVRLVSPLRMFVVVFFSITTMLVLVAMLKGVSVRMLMLVRVAMFLVPMLVRMLVVMLVGMGVLVTVGVFAFAHDGTPFRLIYQLF